MSVKIINDDPGHLEICWILISNFTLYLISQLKALSPPWASNFKQWFFLFFLLVSLISIFVMDVDRNAAQFKFGHSCVCAHFFYDVKFSLITYYKTLPTSAINNI